MWPGGGGRGRIHGGEDSMELVSTNDSHAYTNGASKSDGFDMESLHHNGHAPSIAAPTPHSIEGGLTSEDAEMLLKTSGRNELEEKTRSKLVIFLSMLWGPMPIMIWVAILVELAIGNYGDMAILLAIQFVNAFIAWYETTKAGDAVKALRASLKPQATVCRDGKWQTIEAAVLVPNDLVLLASGSHVPADCRIVEGAIDVDQSALTGESLPTTMRGGEQPLMGSTVVRGEVHARVELTGRHTFFGRTAALLQEVQHLGSLQRVLMKVVVVLLILSFTLCGIVLIFLLTRHESVRDTLGFVVVLLVASIPIAIEIVSTTTLALGSRQLAQQGAIVTRLAAIEEMAGMNILCSDKTGTLTLNQMAIQDECPVFAPGQDRASVLQHAAMAAKWWEPARDALDTMVLNAADTHALRGFRHTDYLPFDPMLKRTEATVVTPDGKEFKVTKGAAAAVCSLLEGPEAKEATAAVDARVAQYSARGIRCMAVARTREPQGDWQVLGLLTFLDPPRPDTAETLRKATAHGVDTLMVTGDNVLIAKETARTLGMGTYIRTPEGLPQMPPDGKVPKDLGKKYAMSIACADGFAQVFPEHKFLIVETLRQAHYGVGMTGDGVNDAPALKRADVGIAVSGSTDAARAAADIVLTEPGLSTIVDAIVIARKIFRRISNFINYRIAATLQLLLFFFIAVFAFEPVRYNPEWPTYFQLPVLMLMLITLLNDGTLISIGYDRAEASPRPEKWNLRAIFFQAAVLGGVACLSSLLLLWACLDSGRAGSLFRRIGLPPLPYEKLITLIYLKVSISDFLTLFSSRTSSFFFTSRPSNLLLGAAVFSLSISTILAACWPPITMHPDLPVEGLSRGSSETGRLWPLWVWLYCLVWWLIQDTLKVISYQLLFLFDVFRVRSGPVEKLVGQKLRAIKVGDDGLSVDLEQYTAGAVKEQVDAGLTDLRAAYQDIQADLVRKTDAPDEEQLRLKAQASAVSRAAGSLERVAQVMAVQAEQEASTTNRTVSTVGPMEREGRRQKVGKLGRRSSSGNM